MTDAVVARELERCDAISRGDLEALARILGDDVTHTHVTGKTDDKAAVLENLRRRPRTTTRGDDLRVRMYGDIAVMTGTMRNMFHDGVEQELHALQVWVKAADGWQQVAFAASGRPPGG